jgi:hypothetical protein
VSRSAVIRSGLHAALVSGVGLLLGYAAWGMARGLAGGSLPVVTSSWWCLLAAVGGLVIASFWDHAWHAPAMGLYFYALAALGFGQLARGFPPGRYFIWGNASDLAAFLLVMALGGWLTRAFSPVGARLRVPVSSRRFSTGSFCFCQAVLSGITMLQTVWISWDQAFDPIGVSHALFGLSGRLAACSMALMLLGATILMAWQTEGRWRAVWQSAALVSGLLFTSSFGWARIAAPADLNDVQQLWRQRALSVFVSASMLTVMTRFGLPLVLPGQSDWIRRARRGSPVFASLAVLALATFLIQSFVLGNGGR